MERQTNSWNTIQQRYKMKCTNRYRNVDTNRQRVERLKQRDKHTSGKSDGINKEKD